ncbi:hypothetical protein DDD_3601 [Nonlabens dokdonensis DSW-6]|uniref:Uncharacterized protein n=1 Tax=Nonlabens dokdonensis (strain DSM 17205 / KCTC 12402 / DSW-6) TaxID=592029 RepID=L7WIA0_NONDD|nr:hypothetical protein DDD_3601 [Nonlabens dokdonensis DSW-6]
MRLESIAVDWPDTFSSWYFLSVHEMSRMVSRNTAFAKAELL